MKTVLLTFLKALEKNRKLVESSLNWIKILRPYDFSLVENVKLRGNRFKVLLRLFCSIHISKTRVRIVYGAKFQVKNPRGSLITLTAIFEIGLPPLKYSIHKWPRHNFETWIGGK